MDAIVLVGMAALAALALGGKKKPADGVAPTPNAPGAKEPVKVDAPPEPGEAESIVRAAAEEKTDRASQTTPYDVPPASTPDADDDVETKPPMRVVKQSGGRYTVQTQDGGPVSPNPAIAKRSAQQTADHVRSHGSKYNRALVAAWQALAGIPSDGLYGPATVAALRKHGAKNVTGAQFRG